jgi:L-asparaginase II
MIAREPSGLPFVRVTRGSLVESVHAIAACAVDVRGGVALAYGDVDAPVYLRSAAKPFIAAAIVASGAADRFEFSARELAVVCASHDGEPFHVDAVRGILAKIGRDRSALQCGTHPPSYEPAAAALAAAGEAPSALHNNCSGKHAGILAMCAYRGFDDARYLEADHPVQREILAFCARLVGEDPAELVLGIDGCGIPVFATTLRRAARAFARFATLEDLLPADAAALAAVRDAMVAEPAYVGGTARFDTALIRESGGRVVGKAGAEGVHGDALRGLGLGLALKVIDGSRRAMPVAATALLRELGGLDAGEAERLKSFARPEVRNVAGRIVGETGAWSPDTIRGARTS